MAPFPTGLGWCQHTQRRKGRGRMKSAEEIMNVLEAYDLTGSYRDAAELAGCSHHTVAHYVALRAAGKLTAGQGARRPQLVDEFLPKLEELVDRSHGRIRADVAHRKLAAMGFTGCERTTRRAVAGLKAAWRDGHRRGERPWVPEPGKWGQEEFGDGPRVAGTATVLFCFWLALPLSGGAAAAGQDPARRARRRPGAAPRQPRRARRAGSCPAAAAPPESGKASQKQNSTVAVPATRGPSPKSYWAHMPGSGTHGRCTRRGPARQAAFKPATARRVVRSQPVKPIAASFRCATSARIRPCERSTSSSSFGRNSSTSCGRRAPWPAVSFPAARSAT